jgi:hypothetical protein
MGAIFFDIIRPIETLYPDLNPLVCLSSPKRRQASLGFAQAGCADVGNDTRHTLQPMSFPTRRRRERETRSHGLLPRQRVPDSPGAFDRSACLRNANIARLILGIRVLSIKANNALKMSKAPDYP